MEFRNCMHNLHDFWCSTVSWKQLDSEKLFGHFLAEQKGVIPNGSSPKMAGVWLKVLKKMYARIKSAKSSSNLVIFD